MRKIVMSVLCFLLISVNLFAADGDLIVDGNVGIGIVSTDKKLDVNGQIKWGYGLYNGFRTPDEPMIGKMLLSHFNGADIGLVEYISDNASTYAVIGGFSTALNGITKLGIHTSADPMTNSATPMMEFMNADTVIVNPKNKDMDFIVKDGNEKYAIFVNGFSGKVGIGTDSPQSRLAVNGLPNSAPDNSGPSYIVCIDPSGNMWIDDDGDNDCQ